MVATNRSAMPGVRVSPSAVSCSRGTPSNSITVLPNGRVRSSMGFSARAGSALSAATSSSVWVLGHLFGVQAIEGDDVVGVGDGDDQRALGGAVFQRQQPVPPGKGLGDE